MTMSASSRDFPCSTCEVRDEAICEALTRPNMRFVSIKTTEQQAVLTVHRARELLSTQRKALINQIRGLLGEYGIVVHSSRPVVSGEPGRRIP